MSIESSHDNGPEQSTADKAGEMLRHLEKGEAVQLYNAMSKLGDDPSFVGRVNLMTRNPSFVDKFNKNKPANMPPLDTRKDAYGYKGTADQNSVFVKTYLEMKASETATPGEKPEVKERPEVPQETDPNAPKDGEGDLDDWLGFMPRGSEKQAVNTSLPIDVDLSKKSLAIVQTLCSELSSKI